MIKKIRIWKMIGLYIITFGIYGFVWIARRRNEIQKHYKLPVPHWLWLIIPSAAGILLLIPIAVVVYGTTSRMENVSITIMGLMAITIIVAFGISLWWMWKYGGAIEKITRGRVPLMWTMGYWIVLGPITLFMHQYYFNRIPASVNLKAKTKYEPTKNLVIIFIILAVISWGISIAFTTFTPNNNDEWAASQQKIRELDHKAFEAEHLNTQYNECIDRLNKTYPGELMIEDEAAYTKSYDTCESIRLKQNTAADAYNEALKNW